jgi:hypothetical protein
MLCETGDEDRLVGWLGTEGQLFTKKGKKTVRIPQECCLYENDAIATNC